MIGILVCGLYIFCLAIGGFSYHLGTNQRLSADVDALLILGGVMLIALWLDVRVAGPLQKIAAEFVQK